MRVADTKGSMFMWMRIVVVRLIFAAGAFAQHQQPININNAYNSRMICILVTNSQGSPATLLYEIANILMHWKLTLFLVSSSFLLNRFSAEKNRTPPSCMPLADTILQTRRVFGVELTKIAVCISCHCTGQLIQHDGRISQILESSSNDYAQLQEMDGAC